MFVCQVCQKSFTVKRSLVRHQLNIHPAEKVVFECDICLKVLSRNDKLVEHMKNHHSAGVDVVTYERCTKKRELSPQPSTSTSRGVSFKKPRISFEANVDKNSRKRELSPQPSTSRAIQNKKPRVIFERCYICNVDVEENKMQEHESTSSHRNILDTLFEGDDGEFAVENNQRIPIIRCEICDEDIEDNKVREHELKASHKSLIEQVTSGNGYELPQDNERCEICNINVERNKMAQHQRKASHKALIMQFFSDNVSVINQAFRNRIKTYSIKIIDESILDVNVLFAKQKSLIKKLLENEMGILRSFKINIELFGDFVKSDPNSDELISDVKSMQTKMCVMLSNNEIDEKLQILIEEIKVKLEEFQEKESGWALLSFLRLEINLNKYQPLGGSIHFTLPDIIKNKHACINVENLDEFCFKWCILAAMYENDEIARPQRTSSYSCENNIADDVIEVNGKLLNFKNMVFPLAVRDVKIFEENNPEISVNVFGYEISEKNNLQIIGPFYHTKKEQSKHINLLFCENNDGRKHYVLIKNISRLIRSQLTTNMRKGHLCNGCLQYFASDDVMKNHKSECCKVITIMPEGEKSSVKFEKYGRKLEVPFVVYADFESILLPISQQQPNPSFSSTTDVQQHVPCAFSYFIKCTFDEKYNLERTFVGKNHI